MKTKMKSLLLIMMTFFSVSMTGQTDTIKVLDLANMSLDQLMNTEVKTGTLFKMKTQNLPVYITTINEDQIRVSGAKHLADLIEMYVPDLMYMLHTQPRIGGRGVINDRQEKTLVLVNGHIMNQKTAVGATLEYTNWDLNDIEKIDIISGPGSVTYGPGAITSVICITTKNGDTDPGIKAGTQYVTGYDSKLAYLSYGKKGPKFNVYAYGSYTGTSGGKIGDVFTTNASGIAVYQLHDDNFVKIYGDVLNKPQLKGYLELNYSDEWTLRARYTNSGTSSFVSNGTLLLPTKDGSLRPGRFSGQNGILLDLENNHKFSDKLSLKTNLSSSNIHSFDFAITTPTRLYNEGSYGSTSKGNIIYDFLEKEISLNTVANYELEKVKVALGYNFTYDKVAKTDGLDTVFMLYNNTKSTDGKLFKDQMYNGWDGITNSVFGEVYLTLHPMANFLFSGRVDKNTYSEAVVSPRIAYIAEINPKNTFKLIVQQSVRIPSLQKLTFPNCFSSGGIFWTI
jgi:hypothetical protein